MKKHASQFSGILYFAALTFMLTSCMGTSSTGELKIVDRAVLQDLPGASGIVWHNNRYWVAGDDARVLYLLDESFAVKDSLEIPEMRDIPMVGGRVPKKMKSDWEALTVISGQEIICVASGSKSPQRDKLLRITGRKTYRIEEYSLTDFFAYLRRSPELQSSELNLEAAALVGGDLYLFNRANNKVLWFSYKDFMLHLNSGAPVPKVHFAKIKTPMVDGHHAGVSGATFHPETGCMLMTCSVEDTGNAYDDGAILGSYLALVRLEDISNDEIAWMPVGSEGEPLKVESVEVRKVSADGKQFTLVMVVDNDNGRSEILSAVLNR